MAVPYVKNVLRGWTKEYTVYVVTQTIVDSKTVDTLSTGFAMRLNKQPITSEKVNRKPMEQRSWRWFTINVERGPELRIDDLISIEGTVFKIMEKQDWIESGFRAYEAIEDYQ